MFENLNPTIGYVYLGVLSYFLFGALVTWYIARKQSKAEKNLSYLKYLVYLLIVNIVILTIIFSKVLLFGIIQLIVIISIIELCRLYFLKKSQKHRAFLLSLFLLISLSVLFLLFSFLSMKWVLFTYILVMVSDASSQHSGQLFGRHKVFGRVSPNKTLEGLVGGILMTLLTAVLLHTLIGESMMHSLLIGLYISIFANLGDLLASLYKRRYQVKDFSSLIPAHGGFLDRFDSFIMAGSMVYLLSLFIQTA